MTELLSCPFCGDAFPELRKEDGRFCVICTALDCFCTFGEGYDGDAMPDHSFHEAEAAINAWNTRAAPVPQCDAEPVRVVGASNIVDEAACLIFAELCPGMVMGDEDRTYYEAAAKAVLALPRSRCDAGSDIARQDNATLRNLHLEREAETASLRRELATARKISSTHRRTPAE